MDAYGGAVHQSHASRDRFADISPNISVRNEFGRSDYEYFRPGEAIPKQKKQIIQFCMEAYRKIGIIRNIIDLMSDFGSQGIGLTHPNPRILKLYEKWWEKIHGAERSERFLNLLYRTGNVICKRSMGKLTPATTDRLQTIAEKTALEEDVEIPSQLTTAPGLIPWQFNFLNPMNVEIAGGELAQFTGKQIYVLKVTHKLRQLISYPTNEFERELIKELPADMVAAIKSGKQYIRLPEEKLKIFHYKKDDWDGWSDPMLYAILDDLVLLEKMKLADLAALDGAISQIRVWKLGDLEQGIFPTDEAITRLTQILLSNPGGGAFDLIWGPDLTVDSIKTDVHQFLGKEKYEPCLENIYAGLGVPPTLTGSQNAVGMTNNYVALKTLVQRLEYGRKLLVEFWNQEIELFRQAMGLRLPAKLRFDRMILSDEAAEKALLVQLWDRNLVSDDTILERFGEDGSLELLRGRRERRERKSGTRLSKAGQWHTDEDEKMHDLNKLALQRTLTSPNQAGLPVKEQYKKNPFLDALDAQTKMKAVSKPSGGGGGTTKKTNKGGNPGQGRPKTSKDSNPRKRTEKPRTGIGFTPALVWAKEAQDKVNDIIMPGLLKRFGKSNMRQLSADQFDQCEYIKYAVLAYLEPLSEVTVESVYNIISQNLPLPKAFAELHDKFHNEIMHQQNREPSIKDMRIIQTITYAIIKGELDG
jgi:hypothetical protein